MPCWNTDCKQCQRCWFGCSCGGRCFSGAASVSFAMAAVLGAGSSSPVEVDILAESLSDSLWQLT